MKVGPKQYKYFSLPDLKDKRLGKYLLKNYKKIKIYLKNNIDNIIFFYINKINVKIETLPYSIRVLLECALRNCDEFNIKKADVEKILAWE